MQDLHHLYNLGRTKLSGLLTLFLIVSWTGLMENQSFVFVCKIFPGHTTLSSSVKVQSMMEKARKISKIESSSVRCTTTLIGDEKTMEKLKDVIPQVFCAKDFSKGHWSFFGLESEEKKVCYARL